MKKFYFEDDSFCRSIMLWMGIACLFFGVFLWSGVLGLEEDMFLQFYGCVMFFLGFCTLTFVGYSKKKTLVFSLLMSVFLTVVVFCIFASVGTVPGVPDRAIYAIIATPFMVCGTIITSIDFIKVKIKRKDGTVEEATFKITTKKHAITETIEIERVDK